jgi:hypothetical protein
MDENPYRAPQSSQPAAAAPVQLRGHRSRFAFALACVAVVQNAFVALPIAVLFGVAASMADDTSPTEQAIWCGCALAFAGAIVMNLFVLANRKRLAGPMIGFATMLNVFMAASALFWLFDSSFQGWREAAAIGSLTASTIAALALTRRKSLRGA